MHSPLSSDLNNILQYSKEEAMRLGNYNITPDHLILGILRTNSCLAYKTIESLGINIQELKKSIDSKYREESSINEEDFDKVLPNNKFDRAIKIMYLETRHLNESKPNSLHLLLAILRGDNSLVLNKIESFNALNYNAVKQAISNFNSSSNNIEDSYDREINDTEEEDIDEGYEAPRKRANRDSSKTPTLDNFGTDLTLAAKLGKLDKVVGRYDEIERLTQILCRRKKNNPILIGDPGVGKSTIIEGLASRIASNSVSKVLMNKRVISLDLGSIVAGSKYRGQFEERIKSIVREATKNPDVILFIDEIHNIIGAGSSPGSLDAANLLKPALARGEIKCIGSTSINEYKKSIEKDSALERRFQKIIIPPTSPDETLDILRNIKDKYESYHNVKYTDDALNACIEFSIRYITDRSLPDKAIDLLDEAGSKNHLKEHKTPKRVKALEDALTVIKKNKEQAVNDSNFEQAALYRDIEKAKMGELEREVKRWEKAILNNPTVIDKEDIAHILSITTKIPVSKLTQSESNKLTSMKETLKKRIIGQDSAVEKVTKAIIRNRAGLKDPNKPIGTFLFLGPTGVGKTELAKVIAEQMFNSTDNLIRVDMSEYMEKFSVSRIIGPPPGYVGYSEGGELSEKVKRKPYSVVLLDEIEKAHPDIYNILLQILDEGRLTESSGRYIDFRNCIIIMTSNIGTKELQNYGQGVGFANSTRRDTIKESNSIVSKALKGKFTPEFLNRLDGEIIFNSLDKSAIDKITEIEIKSLSKRVEKAGYKIKISKEVKKFIQEKGYNPAYGARPLKRAIQEFLEDTIAEAIVSGVVNKEEVINILMNKAKDGVVVKNSVKESVKEVVKCN